MRNALIALNCIKFEFPVVLISLALLDFRWLRSLQHHLNKGVPLITGPLLFCVFLPGITRRAINV